MSDKSSSKPSQHRSVRKRVILGLVFIIVVAGIIFGIMERHDHTSSTGSNTAALSQSSAKNSTAAASIPSSFPDASDTGVPSGTTLSTYTGPLNITTANTTISGKLINGCVTISTANVTIMNSRIECKTKGGHSLEISNHFASNDTFDSTLPNNVRTNSAFHVGANIDQNFIIENSYLNSGPFTL